MNLTIVIATLNENPGTLANTIASIRETSNGEAHVLIVDDCSVTPVDHLLRNRNTSGVTVVSNQCRCGVGPSRHIGVLHAKTDWVGIMDSHMVCAPGWYEAWLELAGLNSQQTIICGTCLGLNQKNMDDITQPVGVYQGGTLNIVGSDKANPFKVQILEAIWNPPPVENLAEIPCCMGACYFLTQKWFAHINPLRLLRSWGEDELFLSLKSWLAGGDVRYSSKIRIGHIFGEKNQKKPFSTPPGHVAWNKILAIHTLCPEPMVNWLLDQYRRTIPESEYRAGMEIVKRDWHLIATERENNRSLFVRDLSWLASRFNLPIHR